MKKIIFILITTMFLYASGSGVYANLPYTILKGKISGKYLRAIYLGQIKRWENGKRIYVFVLPYNNYTQSIILNSIFILKNRLTEVINSRSNVIMVGSSRAAVKILKRTPGGIAILDGIALLYIDNRLQMLIIKD